MKRLVSAILVCCLLSGCTTVYSDVRCKPPMVDRVTTEYCDTMTETQLTRWWGMPWPVTVVVAPLVIVAFVAVALAPMNKEIQENNVATMNSVAAIK